MTYREAIQQLQDNIEKAYEAAGILRDYASQDEKQAWNETRAATRLAVLSLANLDNKLAYSRATMEVDITL